MLHCFSYWINIIDASYFLIDPLRHYLSSNIASEPYLSSFTYFMPKMWFTWDVGGTRDVGDLLLATRTSASVDERTSTAIAFVTNSLADVVTAGKGFPANLNNGYIAWLDKGWSKNTTTTGFLGLEDAPLPPIQDPPYSLHQALQRPEICHGWFLGPYF